MDVPFNSGVSDTVGMYLIPSSSWHSQCRQFRCSRRLRILSNNEPCLSKKHWNRGSFPALQSQKCATPCSWEHVHFSSRIDFFFHLLCDFETTFADILLLNVPHATSITLRPQFQLLHIGAEFPRRRGRRRLRRFAKPSTKSLF